MILVFARTPRPGEVKKRLIPALGPEGAARLHEQMTRRAVATAVQAKRGAVQLWCSPTRAHPFFQDLQHHYAIELKEQRGRDLGERMHSAFVDALGHARHAILIGADCPALTPPDLRTAAERLSCGADAVIAPAFDGGYVLIGLTKPARVLFGDIEWGSERVFLQTRQRLRALACVWHELPSRPDVDRPEDLALLAADGLDGTCR